MFWQAKQGPYVYPDVGALFFFDEKRFVQSVKNACVDSSADSTTNPVADCFRAALHGANEHLKTRFSEGENIQKLIKDRSAFIDRLLHHAWNQYEWDAGISLYAVGGFGRGEMHPHSDLDLLFLLRKDNSSNYKESIEKFLTFIWDIQLKVGHSVRTAKQCASEAKEDVTVMTNLLERRMIIGHIDVDTELQKHIAKAWPAKLFFKAKMAEQAERHNRYGITEFDLEPNVKESPGGLRDIQTINWIAKRAYNVSGIEKLAGKGFFTEEEYNSLKSAENFIWRVRFGLHTLSPRPKEQLDFENQRNLAGMFGYKDTLQRKAVEQFMQHYYQTASTIREITDVLTQLLGEELSQLEDLNVTPINERFQLRNNYVETTSAEVFKETPSAMLEVFVILSRDKSIDGIHGETIRALREHGNLIDDEFRADQTNRKHFMDLLRSPNNLSVPLQLMSRYAVLGRYLPEFGDIIGLTQHDLFHIYPVDIHTMAVVRNIRRFGLPESRKKFPVSSYAFASYSKTELLVVAGLYHDIGKGRGGDHSELGAVDAERFALNHGFTKRETSIIVWLVQNHLFMSRVAQREDISDPEIVANFARHVGDETRLNLLYTLTTADILATNPTLWNNWRASLMRQLYYATRKILRSGIDNAADTEELVQETKDSATELLNAKDHIAQSYQPFWLDLGDAYFLRETVEDIAWHTSLHLTNIDRLEPLVSIKPHVHYARERATVAFVRTVKSNDLFYSTAIAIGNAGLSIQDARIYEAQGFNFITLYILDEQANPLNTDTNRVERLEKMLLSELDTDQDSSGIQTARTTRQLKQFPVSTETSLTTDHGQSVLEVITADRAGLLATIAEIFLKNEVVLKSAKITTLGERVEDLFVIEHVDGSPFISDAACEKLQSDIRDTIDQKVEEFAKTY